jgi:hypothetical protein
MMTESATIQKKGVVNKCPSCGAPVGAFASVCESCGHEFAEIDANRTIRALVARFEEIEKEVEQQGLGLSRRTQAIVERKARVIRDFPIPNSREDLQQLIHFIHPKVVDSVKPDPNIEDWRAKFTEVMSRARAAYRNDATALAGFDGLEKSLSTSLSSEIRIKARRNPLFVILLAGVAVLAIGWAVNARMEKSRALACEAEYSTRADTEKAKLEKAYASATQDLQDKRYTQAMASASALRWEQESAGCAADANASARKLWNEKRSQLVALVQQGMDADAAARKAQADQEAAAKAAEAEQQAAVKVAEQNKEAELARIAADRQAQMMRAAAEKERAAASRRATEQRKAATDSVF